MFEFVVLALFNTNAEGLLIAAYRKNETRSNANNLSMRKHYANQLL